MVAEALDDQLVASAAERDSSALGAVYAALAPQVLGYLRAHEVSDAEDVTNEVFLQLIPQLPRLQGGAEGLRRLAFTIARARMIDAARKGGRRGMAIPYDPELDQRAVPSAEDEVEHSEALTRVHRALRLLPEDQRDVVTMRVVADLSLEQTAAVMGRSVGAIKQLQRRGLNALRAALGQGEVTL